MRSLLVLGLAGIVTVASVACGSSTAPLSPTLGVSTITGLTLSVTVAGVGATVQQAATVALSNGHTPAIMSGFTSDTPSVATITPGGLMTGVSIGDVTISVDYQGFHASQKVRVLPDYSGTFQHGTYTVDSCQETDGFAAEGFCASIMAQVPAGSNFTIAMSNAQSADLTSLTGQFYLGSVLGSSTGTVSPLGVLSYAGSFLYTSTRRMDFQNFTATSPSVGHISGHFQQVWTDSAVTGSSVWSCTIIDLAR